jgi:hypothetical protein
MKKIVKIIAVLLTLNSPLAVYVAYADDGKVLSSHTTEAKNSIGNIR